MRHLKVILSIAMTGILLFSSMGFSVNRHYCMGMLMDESFYSLPVSCEADGEYSCDSTEQTIHTGCCDDESLAFMGIDVINFIKKQGATILINTSVFFPSVVLSLPQSQTQANTLYTHPPEPLPYGRTLLVQVQRFLI